MRIVELIVYVCMCLYVTRMGLGVEEKKNHNDTVRR